MKELRQTCLAKKNTPNWQRFKIAWMAQIRHIMYKNISKLLPLDNWQKVNISIHRTIKKTDDNSIHTGTKKQNAIATVSSPYYRPVMIPDVLLFQANTNIFDCVNIINKFFKSKFSNDLKIYIKDNTNLLTDLQKTSVNLGYLDTEKPDISFLRNSMFALCQRQCQFYIIIDNKSKV